MKVMLLKLIFVFMSVGIAVAVMLYNYHKDYAERLPATPEQLTAIAQEIPCAKEEFIQALKPEVLEGQFGPLSLRNAKKLASDCRERNELKKTRQAREDESRELREKQLKALNGINK
ncbi:hypothetical protein ACWYA4_26910 (plasmid) [Klebsiella grimontii]|uniref:hypothetical protein n=1 Tax=Klebsiella oxytoca TaxID=571 RepID=UPI00388E272D